MTFKQGIALLPSIMITLVMFAGPHSQAAQQKSQKQTTKPEAGKKQEPAHNHNHADHAADHATEANRITVEQLKASIEKNEPVTIIDVRSEGSYESSDTKIKGSVRMQTDEIESRMKEIPPDRLVVTYCT